MSRIDVCVDSDEVSFVESDLKGMITKARKKERHFHNGSDFMYGKKFSGFSIGNGSNLLARIYNKTLEINKSEKTWFYQIWNENSWDRVKDVWRAEFQIRREILKEFGINRIEDFLDKEKGLWSYLTGKWLNIKQPKGENVSRWEQKKKWVKIQNAGMTEKVSPIIREEVKMGDVNSLLDQGTGIVLSVAALSDHKTLEETLLILNSWAKLKLNKKQISFEGEKDRRRKKFVN